MNTPVPVFHKKKIKKKHYHKKERDLIPAGKKKTKAALKKGFYNNCKKALEHIDVFNRILMKDEKIAETRLNFVRNS
jgi:hypothetical protein